MPFGHELWDQWREVEEYAGNGIQFLDKLTEFIRKRSEIEAEYSQRLGKLAKSYKDELSKKVSNDRISFTKAIQSSSVSQSWLQLLTETEAIAGVHESIANSLEKDLRKQIKEQSKKNSKTTEKMFDEIRDLINQFKKAVEHLERMRNKYEQADKDRASALVAYNKANADINATKKDVERLRQESERRTAMALNAMEDYTKCIAETNELKNKHYTELLPAVLDKFQTDDETERIDFARTHLMKYAEICLTQIPTETQSLESMKATFNTINSQYDSELFIKMMRTGCEIPPDYEFQQKALVGAISPKKPSSSFGKTLTKSPSKLTPDDNIEDAILAIPGNKGKKKANERIKVLDKEVIECEKKLHGLESMMEHKKLKSEGEREHLDQELQEQQAKLQQKRESLLQKREKLRLFISGIDGSSYISQTRSPDETSSISQTESFSSSISSSSPSRSTNLDTKLKSPPLRTLSRQDEEDEVEKVTNWDAKSQSKKSSDTSSKKSGETVGTKSLTATPSFSGGAPPPPPPMPMFLSNAAIPDNGALAIKKAKRVMAQVLYDFDAEPDTEEMGVKTGDVLEILEKQDDGWWRAKFENENGDEVEGLVPGNYLEEI